MPHRVPKYPIDGWRRLERTRLRGSRFLVAGVLWIAVAFPVAAQSVILDTGKIPLPYIATALRQAYQLPILIGVKHTPAEREGEIATEKARLQGLIAGFGYLDGEVAVEHSEGRTVLRPTLGGLYRVASVELKGVRQSELDRSVVDNLASIAEEFVGQPASTVVAETFTRRILQAVSGEDFAHARRRSIDWVRKGGGVVTAVIELDLGPRSRFGAVRFSGALRMHSELQRLVPFHSGDPYSAAAIEKLRRNIEALETVKSVRIAIGKDEGGVLPIDVRISEAPANLEALRHTEPLDVGSGLVAMAGLMLVQVAAQAGLVRSRLRPLVWVTTACVLTFAVLATLRLFSFLA